MKPDESCALGAQHASRTMPDLGWMANQDSVLVRYNDGTVQELPAHRYVAQKYLPSMDDLTPCPRALQREPSSKLPPTL